MSEFRPVLARVAAFSPIWAAAVIVGGAALLAWSAQLAIPLEPVPITLQSYVLISLAALLGWRLGGAAVLLYVALGLGGLPVFSNGRSGLAMLAGPSGGFIVGFVVVTLLVGWLQQNWARLKVLPLFGALGLGHLVLMAMGAGWLAASRGVAFAMEKGFLPFVPGAVLKTIAALATIILVERLAGAPRAR